MSERKIKFLGVQLPNDDDKVVRKTYEIAIKYFYGWDDLLIERTWIELYQIIKAWYGDFANPGQIPITIDSETMYTAFVWNKNDLLQYEPFCKFLITKFSLLTTQEKDDPTPPSKLLLQKRFLALLVIYELANRDLPQAREFFWRIALLETSENPKNPLIEGMMFEGVEKKIKEKISENAKKGAVSRHKNNTQLKDKAISIYIANKHLLPYSKSKRKAAQKIYEELILFANQHGIPPLSIDSGLDTVYRWLLKI